jgi:hypothetical protein
VHATVHALMANLLTLRLGELVRDTALVRRLLGGGEPLLVERAGAEGAPAAVASLANTLGGWVLLTDLHAPQDLDLARLLGAAVDPPVPASAAAVEVDGRTVGIIRVAASHDGPHAIADGTVLVRDGDGMRPADAATVRALAARREQGDAAARERQYGSELIEDAMRTPEKIPGDAPILDPDSYGHDEPLEFIVRATPLTVTRDVQRRALTAAAADLAARQAIPLLVDPDAVAHRVSTAVEGRANGVYCTAERGEAPIYADLAIDAAGVVAARLAERRQRDGTVTPAGLIDEVLLPLLRTAAGTLDGLGASGRALAGLEIRGATDLMVEWTPEHSDVLRLEELLDEHRLVFGGDLGLPAGDRDLQALGERWTRSLARAAGLPAWEP